MIRITKLFLVLLFCCNFTYVAKVNAATIHATSCSQSDMQSAISSASDGDMIIVPSGNCTWTSAVTLSGKAITIQGAGIDVFEQEPVPPDNPLLKMDNVIVTPHYIGLTEEFFVTIWHEIAGQISRIIRGEVPHTLVNPEVWDKPEFQSKLKAFREALG